MDAQHAAMIDTLRRYKIHDERVITAMSNVRRHLYIPVELRDKVDPYGDHPCPIGYGQTISQPFMVAYMTQQLGVKPGMRILEIGTGSGYQSAVLAEMGAQVFSIEIVPELARYAREVLNAEGYGAVNARCGDGYKGWPEYAPYDAVILTCAPPVVPEELVHQLKDGGLMILPVGTGMQQLILLEKDGHSVRKTYDIHVRFVPMVAGGTGKEER